MIKEIKTAKAPQAIGPYSQATQAGNLVFLSGQLGLDPSTGKMVEGGVREQTTRVLKNIEAILKEVGLGFEQVARAEIYLKDLNDFKAVNEIYGEVFSHGVKPARQTMQVGKLPLDALVEISCIAVKA